MSHEYLERVNAVIQYMKENSDRRLTLDELAAYSNFSKYHFSRIFASVVGITPIAYVNELRMSRSLEYLTHTDQSVLAISELCGFESVAAFNAAFKKRFNQTPREARTERQQSNMLEVRRKMREELSGLLRYDKSNESSFLRRIWDMNVAITELPEYEVAYFRHEGSYLDTGHAWAKLGAWATGNGICPPKQHFIGISLDDPNDVAESECRYDACVTLPEGFDKRLHANVSFKALAGGQYALYRFYDTVDKLAIIYQGIFGQWLPGSGYEADERPCLEFCLNDPATDKEGKCKVDLYIPVKQRSHFERSSFSR
ncbi:GyrI-like domain-containing protein [Paenibacillus sp. NPDC058071]|uniref:AraC family transcriptional regulator n=1 Tax=Paenibacillus sp. NPDC058071 TaxID=3346326 RepID=UPI0036DF2CCE